MSIPVLHAPSFSRRDVLRVLLPALLGAAVTPSALALTRRRLLESPYGPQIREYLIQVAGPSGAYVVERYAERLWIQDATPADGLNPSLPPFHVSFAAPYLLLGADPLEMQVASGAYLRSAGKVFYDSEDPRIFKDLAPHEMRCALEPEVRKRFGGEVPFPCGLRVMFDGAWEPQYQQTINFYRNYHGIDVSSCDLEYARPAQTMARLNAGKKKPIMTFGIVDRRGGKINRAQLFGPEAV